jgi:hypothetical protein
MKKNKDKDKGVIKFVKEHEAALKKRDKSRDLWLVWATKADNRGREVTDLRAIEETATGADFVKEILNRDESEADVFIEKRISHHIYGHRDIQVARRFARIGE